MKPILHVEVQLLPGCVRPAGIREAIARWLEERFTYLKVDQEIKELNGCDQSAVVSSIHVFECAPHDVNSSYHALDSVHLDLHIYVMHEAPEVDAESNPSLVVEDGDENEAPSLTMYKLPNAALDDIWQSLHFESSLRERLLHQLTRMMLLIRRGCVDWTLHNWNRLILLHGPPGSGKSSLCRALAQRLAVRSCENYLCAHLVEINANSFHSKWFGESGKEIAKTFKRIYSIAQDPEALVCVLIDEVETVAGSREQSAMNGEVGDALRATNQLLTALDKLRRFTNVLVFCTSNLVQTIDSAFLNRADIVKYIGNPTPAAAYEILRSCLNDLISGGLISTAGPVRLAPGDSVNGTAMETEDGKADDGSQTQPDVTLPPYRNAVLCEPIEPDSIGTLLLATSKKCAGFSGRVLRRLPLLALTTYTFYEMTPLHDALDALDQAVDEEKRDDDEAMEGGALLGQPNRKWN